VIDACRALFRLGANYNAYCRGRGRWQLFEVPR
jgi:hypothetical protein